ncbi:MAG: hypothetical protein JNK26_02870 [Candidatus Doudnabacteria bacterium]|nr:hypothetical protein [Candidatus Doudnabacteria bacterium]
MKYLTPLATASFLPIVLLTLFLTFRRDSNFPFNNGVSPIVIAIYTLLSVVFLYGVVIWYFKGTSRPQSISPKVLTTLLVTLFSVSIVLGLVLMRLTSTYFPGINTWNDWVMLGVGLVSLLVFSIALFSRKPKLILGSLAVSTILISLLPIIYFPITAKISDLLPAILKQIESFIQGQSIYQVYLLDNGVWQAAVRQPLSALSFLPAYLLNIDIRFMSLLFHLGVAAVLFKGIYPNTNSLKLDSKFLFTCILLVAWLLFPYRLLRHDLYEPSYWFVLALSLLLLVRNYRKWWMITWGIGIATQVWSWVFTPFLGIYLIKKWGSKTAATYLLGAVAIGGVLIALFALPNFSGYMHNVFGIYGNASSYDQVAGVYPMYLTPILNLLGLTRFAIPLLVASCAAVFLLFIRKPITFPRTLMYMCLLLLTFCMFNRVSWNYMYINLVVLMLARELE